MDVLHWIIPVNLMDPLYKLPFLGILILKIKKISVIYQISNESVTNRSVHIHIDIYTDNKTDKTRYKLECHIQYTDDSASYTIFTNSKQVLQLGAWKLYWSFVYSLCLTNNNRSSSHDKNFFFFWGFHCVC